MEASRTLRRDSTTVGNTTICVGGCSARYRASVPHRGFGGVEADQIDDESTREVSWRSRVGGPQHRVRAQLPHQLSHSHLHVVDVLAVVFQMADAGWDNRWRMMQPGRIQLFRGRASSGASRAARAPSFRMLGSAVPQPRSSRREERTADGRTRPGRLAESTRRTRRWRVVREPHAARNLARLDCAAIASPASRR